MDIRNRKELCDFAAGRLENAPQRQKIALIFACCSIGLSIAAAVASYLLGLQIDKTGGLSNMGLRSILSALQTMLPLVQSAVVMCLELGFTAAMLRIARGQYVSPQTLRLGFDRFWVLLRLTLLESLLLLGIGFGAAYLGIMIFMISPLSENVIQLLTPLLGQSTLLDPASAITIPEDLYSQVLQGLIPAYVLCALFFAVGAVPLMYRLRMSSYVVIDKPGLGAMTAMRESRKMMRGNCLHLFRLDLRLWWIFAANLAASVLCYGDQILPALGVSLPFSADTGFFLFYGLYWAAQFAIFCFLLPRAEVPYALAYDAIRPKEPETKGVILGNIFQM